MRRERRCPTRARSSPAPASMSGSRRWRRPEASFANTRSWSARGAAVRRPSSLRTQAAFSSSRPRVLSGASGAERSPWTPAVFPAACRRRSRGRERSGRSATGSSAAGRRRASRSRRPRRGRSAAAVAHWASVNVMPAVVASGRSGLSWHLFASVVIASPATVRGVPYTFTTPAGQRPSESLLPVAVVALVAEVGGLVADQLLRQRPCDCGPSRRR